MRWKTIFFVILVTVSVQTVIIKAQGFLDPFGLRRRSKERGYESQEEEREEDDNPEPRRTFFGLDLLKPFDINFGSRREADRGRQRDRESRRKQDSEETLENASTGELAMGRSLDLHQRKGNDESSREPEHEENSPESRTGKQVEYGPCGPNNQYCDGENYIKELGLTWSSRVHNGTGIYLRDPNAPGGKRYVLVGIDLPNEKYDYCTTPKNEPGYCRHLEHCVLDDFRSSFIKFLEYLCDIPNQNYVGTCCPRSKDNRKPEGRVPPTTSPRTPPRTSEGREMQARFPPFDFSPPLPFRPLTTTSPPRRRTTSRSRGGGTAGRPRSRQFSDCGQAEKKMPRIVGGRTADPKAWPWMTALLKTSEATDHRAGQYCGGVLITELHVLTASHCVDLGSDIKYLSVRVGEYDFSRRNATSSPDDIPVSEVFIHDKFNRYTYENDIAVIKLARSAFYDERIKYICLPESDDQDNSYVNEKGIVTGFGTIWYGGPTSDTLQEITVPIWKQEDCQAAYSQPIEDTNLCAGVLAGSKDSCQGDSGGPLQVQLKGRWTIVGIVSWGIRCSEPGYPGVYTRVNRYLEWIASQIRR